MKPEAFVPAKSPSPAFEKAFGPPKTSGIIMHRLLKSMAKAIARAEEMIHPNKLIPPKAAREAGSMKMPAGKDTRYINNSINKSG